MPLNDSSPERRNLIVASLAFIIYYLGSGTIQNTDLRIQVVNIHFEDLTFLASFAWIVLFWFLLRFAQSSKPEYLHRLGYEMKPFLYTKIARYILSKHSDVKKKKTDYLAKVKIELPALEIDEYGYNLDIKGFIVNLNYGADNRFHIILRGIQSYVLLSYLYVSAAIFKKTFSDEVFPFLLFIAALISAIVSWTR